MTTFRYIRLARPMVWLGTCALLSLPSDFPIALAEGAGSESLHEPVAHRQYSQWAREFTGRTFYLRAIQLPLLVNDSVHVGRCKIWRVPLGVDPQTAAYLNLKPNRAKLWFLSDPPAPSTKFSLEFEFGDSREDLEGAIAKALSASPLEEAHDWAPEIRRAVRARYIALDMDKEMVNLILGGLPYQVDLERLEDGRDRETWKLQIKGDTRRVYEQRASTVVTTAVQNMPGPGTIIRGGKVSGPTYSQSTGVTSEGGFYVFSGLPPQFLHIIFTDGKVTARKTEFVK